jgi:uncharacterized protein (DUF362 family)
LNVKIVGVKDGNGEPDRARPVQNHPVSRRDFIAVSGAAAIDLTLFGAGSAKKGSTNMMKSQKQRVAVAKSADYNLAALRKTMRHMLDSIGGIGDVIKPGSTVALKINLTGGATFSKALVDYPWTQAHWTHPGVVRVLGELLIDSGAKKLFIMDGVFEAESFQIGGYPEVAKALDAKLIDLNTPLPYTEFVRQPVGYGWHAYEDFIFNRLLKEVDAFVSVPKMKCHNNAGVTLALKGQIGLCPTQFYGLKERPQIRSALHGLGEEVRTRLSKVIVDLTRARPIDLTVIDGIMTAEGGEGPWIKNTFHLIQPGVMVAGRNPVATDSVATAVMGFNPEAGAFEPPFVSSDNHLALARESGLGTNRLEEIEIAGEKLKEAVFPFKPCAKGGYIITAGDMETTQPYHEHPA